MAELPFLHSARHLMLIDICIKFREYSLSGFQVIERTRFVTDRRTDARGKTICLLTLKGGDIKTSALKGHMKKTTCQTGPAIGDNLFWPV